MKKILLICLVITIFVGCQKQPEKVSESVEKSVAESDKKIGEFLDILDDSNANKGLQRKVLCTDYPKLYEHEYLPALLKLSNAEPKDKLMNDLKITTDYYSEKLNITCD
ncbi:hypothetical protein [Acinetobacter tjernbergiae]|uniref:Lipoprotein n=1 Tax=Acinetobacter tjernbergiae DSM 14971 = CIP 107465 TaxID=1120928 RepID=V2W4H2_9GAMM|nr:hypothetical protein [Acinetobacter tjernbergiae]ESK54889.1 hypothetical protein F990_02332 [Acinetobacter tjernbergiae DSM 14971 = CIP 107465]